VILKDSSGSPIAPPRGGRIPIDAMPLGDFYEGVYKPQMMSIAQMIDDLHRRLGKLEENKQVLPTNINVTIIKKEDNS